MSLIDINIKAISKVPFLYMFSKNTLESDCPLLVLKHLQKYVENNNMTIKIKNNEKFILFFNQYLKFKVRVF